MFSFFGINFAVTVSSLFWQPAGRSRCAGVRATPVKEKPDASSKSQKNRHSVGRAERNKHPERAGEGEKRRAGRSRGGRKADERVLRRVGRKWSQQSRRNENGKSSCGAAVHSLSPVCGAFEGPDVTWLAGAKTENDTVLTKLRAAPQGTRWCQRQQGARCDSSLIYGKTDTNGALWELKWNF